MVKERCTLLPDFLEQSSFFFVRPVNYDLAAMKGKWDDNKAGFFSLVSEKLQGIEPWDSVNVETAFKTLATEKNIKAGELLFLFRMMLVGGKFGPPVFDIAAMLGRQETIARIGAMSNIMNPV